MRQIIVHIGMHKSGSSSIQNYMATLDEVHRAEGICYPRSGRSQGGFNNHVPIAKTPVGELRELISEVTAELNSESENRICLISAEEWSTSNYSDNLREVLKLLSDMNPDAEVKVLAYCRNPFNYVESCYAQFVKGGLFGIDPKDFFRRPDSGIEEFTARFQEKEGYPIYSIVANVEQIAKATQGFPVSYRSMEAADLDATSLLADFCLFCGITINEDVAARRRNERINLRQMEVLKQARRVFVNTEFMLLRPYLLEHPLCQNPVAKDVRLAGTHIGSELVEKIRMTLADERGELAQLFQTRTNQLCADTWQPINTEKVIDLTEVGQVVEEAQRVLHHCRRPLFQKILKNLGETSMNPVRKKARKNR